MNVYRRGPQPPQLPSTTSTPSMQNSRSEYLPIFYHCYDPSNSPPFSHLFLCHPHPPSPPSACLPPCQPVSASHVPSGWQCLRARHALPHIGARQAAQRHGLRPLPQPGAAHKEGGCHKPGLAWMQRQRGHRIVAETGDQTVGVMRCWLGFRGRKVGFVEQVCMHWLARAAMARMKGWALFPRAGTASSCFWQRPCPPPGHYSGSTLRAAERQGPWPHSRFPRAHPRSEPGGRHHAGRLA